MSQSVFTNTKIAIQLEDKPLAAAGGEGTVYRVISTGANTNSCVKIYHSHKRTQARKNKIEFMIKNKPQILSSVSYVICWPTEIVFDNKGNFLGFLMSLAFSGSESLYELTRTKTPIQIQQWSKFDRSLQSGIEKRLRICVNISIAVHSIHQSGKYAIVDYKPQNILITSDGKISITDVDSFQIANNGVVLFHSEVATPEYSPPESVKINPSKSFVAESWDRFSLAVSFYEILFGIHPFAASCDGKYQAVTTIGEKIQNGLFVHGSKKNFLTVIPPIHNNFQYLPISLIQLFIKSFEDGHSNANARPTAEQWGETIYTELTTKKGIKANKISLSQQNTPPPALTQRITNTTTYSKLYSQNSPIIKSKNNQSKFWLWFIIVLIGIFVFFNYLYKPAKETTTKTTQSTASSVNRTGYISANGYANIRNGPSTNYVVITKKFRGESVYVLEQDRSTGWYKVRYSNNENVGYISNTLISFDYIKSNQQQASSNTLKDASTTHSVGSSTQKQKTYNKLEGNWVKVKGTYWDDSELGLVISYRNNVGKIITLPNGSNRHIGQVLWKDFNPERNWLQVFVPLSDGYLNNEVKFKNSDTISFSMSGETFVRQQINTSSQSENAEPLVEQSLEKESLPVSNATMINPYGSGNGQVTIYNTFTNCRNVQISIDGIYSGTLTKYFRNGAPDCGTNIIGGTIVKNIIEGDHSITAKDDYGSTWNGIVNINESECKNYALENITKANPFGKGNGMVSFWKSDDIQYRIFIDEDYQGILTASFRNHVPFCQNPGTLSIAIPEGNHTFSAKDSRGEWRGTFNVISGECILIQVNKKQ